MSEEKINNFSLSDVIGDDRTGCAVQSMAMMAFCLDVATVQRGIDNCERALSIGPIVEPTMCQRGGLDNAANTKRVLIAARNFILSVQEAASKYARGATP